jgi:putative glutamine amidotransferase
VSRPLIGLTAYSEPASWGPWSAVRATLLPAGYATHIYAAGGQPLLVPPYEDLEDADADALLRRLDGLVLTGGVDVDPRRYGADRHVSVQASRPDRDAMEIVLARRARALDLPLLGVCRGMQVMAVAGGGVLDQHLPDTLGHTEHLQTPGAFGEHLVTTVDGSVLAGVVGPQAKVASYHHQGVTDHPGYVATAYAPDGTVEGMEDAGRRFCVAVQWHPEIGEDSGVFAAIVDAARARTQE